MLQLGDDSYCDKVIHCYDCSVLLFLGKQIIDKTLPRYEFKKLVIKLFFCRVREYVAIREIYLILVSAQLTAIERQYSVLLVQLLPLLLLVL